MKQRFSLCFLISFLIVVLSCGTVFAAPKVIKGSSDTDTGTNPVPSASNTLIYDMTPVYPDDVADGTYPIDAVSSSQYFRITEAELTKSGDRMQALITISSTSYSYVYQGTAAEAAAADRSEWIPADESTGYGRFTVDVEALNSEMPCAAYSKKKDKWYDRDIAFIASSLPSEALRIKLDGKGSTIIDTQEAAMKVIYIALAIIIAGGVLNHFVKRKFYE